MLNRLGVRFKILATLAVPMIVLVLAAAIFANQALTEARAAQAAESHVSGLTQLENLFLAFNEERLETLWQLETDTLGEETEEQSNPDVLQSRRDNTDRAIVSYQSYMNSLDFDDYDATVERAMQLSEKERRDWTTFRQVIDAGLVSPDRLLSTATTFLNYHVQDFETLSGTVPNRELASLITGTTGALEYWTQLQFDIELINRVIDAQANDVVLPEELYQRLVVIVREGTAKRVELSATIAAVNDPDIILATSNQQYSGLRDLVASGGAGSLTGPLALSWAESSSIEINIASTLATQARVAAFDMSASDSSVAQRTSVLTIGAVIAAVVASIAMALLIARSLTEPLRRLTEAAGEVRDLLPQLVSQVAIPGEGPDLSLAQVPVQTRDEVGRLAEAFNEVNSTTIRVAQEQAALRGSIAEMFVNVARRDQVLLNRQLGFLDELERSEEDPSVLADLFRLDHLATRMRRNAESLLILAGIDTGRRIRQPMPISDVVRTASSEIEMYDRIQLDIQADPLMLGHNALNAAHLIAELLENSTQFSEPNTQVEVTTTRGDGVVQVFIRDYGLGMSQQDLEEANRKVAQSDASEMLGAQRLGLFVVRRVANRLDAKISLHPAPDGNGTVAIITFPEILFAELSDDDSHTGHDSTSQWAPAPSVGAASSPMGIPAVAAEEYQPAMQASQADAPVVREVDIASLTDGSTGSGMPRRRVAQSDEPATTISASGLPVRGTARNDAEEDIVLPPLQTPTLDVSAETATFGWTPPQAAVNVGGNLPARRRPTANADGAPAVQPLAPLEEAPGPVLSGAERHSLFASFRPSNDLVEISPEALGQDASAPPSIQDHSETGLASTGAAQAGEYSQPDSDTALPRRGRHAAPVAPDSAPYGTPQASVEGQQEWAQDAAASATSEYEAAAAPVAASPEPVPMVIPSLEPEEGQQYQQYGGQPAQDVAVPVQQSTSYAEPAQTAEQWQPQPAYQDQQPAYQDQQPAYQDQQAAYEAAPAYQQPAYQAEQPAHQQSAYGSAPAAPSAPAFPSPQVAPTHAAGPNVGQGQSQGPLAFDPAAAASAQLPQFNDLVSGGSSPAQAEPKRGKGSFFGLFRRGRNDQLKRKMEVMPRLTDLVKPDYSEAPAPVVLPQPSEQGFMSVPPTAPWAQTQGQPTAQHMQAPAAQAPPAPPAVQQPPVIPQLEPQSEQPQPTWPPAPPADDTAQYPGTWQEQPQPVTDQPWSTQAPQPWQPPADQNQWSASPAETPAPAWEPQTAPAQDDANQWPGYSGGHQAEAPPAEEQTWAPAPADAPWTDQNQGYAGPGVDAPQPAWQAPEVYESAAAHQWSTPAPAVPEAGPAYVPETAPAPTPAASDAGGFGGGAAPGEWAMPAFDEEATARMAMASGIQEQAFAELSQLSTYRPKEASSTSGLAKRVPGKVPADETQGQSGTAAKISRDAAELRAKLSAFQLATTRARDEQDETEPTLHPTDSASPAQ